MATGNIDHFLSEDICNLQKLNLNIFSNSEASGLNERQSCFSMQPSVSPKIISGTETPDFTNKLQNACEHSSVNDYKTLARKQYENCFVARSNDSHLLSLDGNQNSLSHDAINRHDSYSIFQTHNVIPEELFINVENDDEGIHSWRPNMSSDALCSDFFVTPSLVCEDLNLNLPLQIKTDDLNATNCNNSVINAVTLNLPLELIPEATVPQNQPLLPAVDYPKVDLKYHVRAQVAGLNSLKYETINAERTSLELKEEIKMLTQKLNEKLIVQRALDVEKLKEENAQLRLECQCLCMEVDYYLKGRAPLGEIDEHFYQNNSQQQKKDSSSQDRAESSSNICQSDLSEDPDEHKKWECHVCTFANHPAINSCEMCQTQRLYENLDPKDNCFRHSETHTS